MDSLTKSALQATLHCLTGCAIGEILGMICGSVFGLSNFWTVFLSIVLAFIFGYSLSLRGIMKSQVTFKKAVRLALLADTASITSMEIIDNLIIIIIPNALMATISQPLFWWSLLLSLIIAFIVTVPLNRWLIKRGQGHAVVHHLHHH